MNEDRVTKYLVRFLAVFISVMSVGFLIGAWSDAGLPDQGVADVAACVAFHLVVAAVVVLAAFLWKVAGEE